MPKGSVRIAKMSGVRHWLLSIDRERAILCTVYSCRLLHLLKEQKKNKNNNTVPSWKQHLKSICGCSSYTYTTSGNVPSMWRGLLGRKGFGRFTGMRRMTVQDGIGGTNISVLLVNCGTRVRLALQKQVGIHVWMARVVVKFNPEKCS